MRAALGSAVTDALKCQGKSVLANATAIQNPIETKPTFNVDYANLGVQCYHTHAG